MGQAALHADSLDRLPDPVTEGAARTFCGKCWDDADWEDISGGTGQVAKSTFLITIKIRDHAPSLRAWLEYFRIDEILEKVEELEILTPDDFADVDTRTRGEFMASLKTVQKYHMEKALAHAYYLQAHPLGYMPWRHNSLELWLESWRLMRIKPALFDLGVDVKEDIIDLEESYYPKLGLKLLEEKRWKEAVFSLMSLTKNFNFASQRKSAVPTIGTWIRSLRLEKILDQLNAYGAYELVDLHDIDEKQMSSLNLTKLQKKHWRVGLNQVEAAMREAMADGKADMPTFRGFLESWRLLRIMPALQDMGAVVQQDLLDLEPNEYGLIKMRPLEAKRFEQMMIALEEEFETPPPGEEWNEENMTRRAWRAQQQKLYDADGDSVNTSLMSINIKKTKGAKGKESARSKTTNKESARSQRNKETSRSNTRGRSGAY